MEQRHQFGGRKKPRSRWIRHSLIEAAPLWGQLPPGAGTNVKIN
jgi:hypothetical protein